MGFTNLRFNPRLDIKTKLAFHTKCKARREETNLNQEHIGHTKLTHSFILKQELPLKCSCGKPYTVKRILMECRNLTHTEEVSTM